MIDGNMCKQAPTMMFLQPGIIFDLSINSCGGLHPEQGCSSIDHHDKRRGDAGRVHVLHKIVAGFINHTVQKFWYNHILGATRYLPCPGFGSVTEETGWQKFTSPNMAVTVNNLHFFGLPHSQFSVSHVCRDFQRVYVGGYKQ